MKKSILKLAFVSALALFLGTSVNAQDKKDDLGRVAITAWVPDQIEGMPTTARQSLANKLTQIINKNGVAASSFNSRFILTANIIVATKDLTATAPPMQAYTLDVNLYIGDGLDGTLFASTSIQVKGVGQNETKAYMQALNNIKPENPELAAFVQKGKEKIVEYYNSKCDFLIKEANTLASQNKYEEAIFLLTSVPDACAQCYDKAIAAIGPMYQKMIDRDCKLKLAEASNIWSANQSMDAADQAGAILSSIEPQSSCYGEVKALNAKIAARVKEIDAREWKYILKDQEQKSEMIKAYRDVGVAYGNGQPKSITYNVRGWW
ncbi:MAG: hypothetical protein KFKLKKLM_01379 [Flavobacteriales bacterium]|nr:hypothetical protein [Flavobacteriales bacterium]